MRVLGFVLSVAILFGLKAQAQQWPLLEADGVPWEIELNKNHSRIVVIGDLHGDFQALVRVLRKMDLIDKWTGRWVGGNAIVVTMGDHVDRGSEARRIFNLLFELQIQARKAGGNITSVIANHELMHLAGNYVDLSDASERSYDDFAVGEVPGHYLVYRGNTALARYLRSLNTLQKVGPYLFVHGGLDEWATDINPEQLNATVRAWVKFYQGVGPRPPKETEWVVLKTGKSPIWTRRTSSRYLRDKEIEPLTQEAIESALKYYGCDHLIVGHTPTEHNDYRIDTESFNGRVIQVDTGMTSEYPGRYSALEILPDGKLKTHHWSRRLKSTDQALVTYLRQNCRDHIGGQAPQIIE